MRLLSIRLQEARLFSAGRQRLAARRTLRTLRLSLLAPILRLAQLHHVLDQLRPQLVHSFVHCRFDLPKGRFRVLFSPLAHSQCVLQSCTYEALICGLRSRLFFFAFILLFLLLLVFLLFYHLSPLCKTLLANGINGKSCNTIQQSRTQRYSGSLPDGEASCRLFPQAISLFPSNPLVRNSSLRLPNCSLYMRSEHATVPWNHRFRDPSGPLHGLAPSNFAFSDPSCSYYSLLLLMPIANSIKK